MKNLKTFKKVSAALTVAAMFGTLFTGVFAAEVEEITDVPVIESVEIDVPIISVDVEDIEEVEEVNLGELLADDFDLMSTGDGDVTTNLIGPTDSDITITAVTATKKTVDDETLYNVKLEYTMPLQETAPQITLLGYVFTNTVPDTIEDSSIKAIDQKEHIELEGTTVSEGEINFTLSSAFFTSNIDTATLVLMVGADGVFDNENAQAVAIDLSSASEEGGDLPPAPTTWEATGATVDPDTLSVAADATDTTIKAELANAVVTVTGADSKSSDKVEVAWVTTDEIAAGTTVTYTGTVTPAADADWTGSQTVTVTVTIEAAQGGESGDDVTGGMYGDVTGDGEIKTADWMMILNHIKEVAPVAELNDPTTALFKAADVATDGQLKTADWMMILNHIKEVDTSTIVGTEF
ncbi:MAG: hypothetical protein IKT62_03700 [Firmicutes bacterium]|nr:hypothetical protein [Bacillota bacterium]